MTMKHLPDGGVVVTLNDGMDWAPLDVFTWVAYRERRIPCGDNENAQFPRAEWSRDWVHWPVGNLAAALGEMATEVLCLHTEGSYDEEQADNSRAWARKVMARNGEDARGLAKALAVDLERSRLAEMDYKNAKEEVHVALRAGRLQVWARRAHGQHKSNRNADHEPLGAGVFTLQPREVDESGWVGISTGDDGPWWDEARFKPGDVLAWWQPGEGIAAFASAPTSHSKALVGQHKIVEWLTTTAEAEHARTGKKPKRDGLIRDCVAVLECRYEDAEAAHLLLPEHLRRQRGEKG